MSDYGLERLVTQAKEEIEAAVRLSHEYFASYFDSPIEALFSRALHVAHRLCPVGEIAFVRDLDVGSEFRTCEIEERGLTVLRQARCLDWPVDFLYVVQDQAGKRHHAVVECDGHDFHERTKEQAQRDRSRDRRLQEAGYRVFRFTGSEIYRNPMGCAREVLEWARDRHFGV